MIGDRPYLDWGQDWKSLKNLGLPWLGTALGQPAVSSHGKLEKIQAYRDWGQPLVTQLSPVTSSFKNPGLS